ncbi:uncharacterized protein PSFLO_02381 [Pseudozyma flocculosa]|uniref:Uncharacterized protein n=1 Tax=Pseudozyma flocculosa TaxID=84751 RepID=A0A5C3EYG5_9BASI|nr:uncharacterized protein PSFLO_02381 [Pseudozyma flocculosa]
MLTPWPVRDCGAAATVARRDHIGHGHAFATPSRLGTRGHVGDLLRGFFAICRSALVQAWCGILERAVVTYPYQHGRFRSQMAHLRWAENSKLSRAPSSSLRCPRTASHLTSGIAYYRSKQDVGSRYRARRPFFLLWDRARDAAPIVRGQLVARSAFDELRNASPPPRKGGFLVVPCLLVARFNAGI